MNSLKYIVYGLTAIAIPLWIILAYSDSKSCTVTTIAIDSNTISQLSKVKIYTSVTPSESHININGAHLDSLFTILVLSSIQNKSKQDSNSEKLQTSINELKNIANSNSQYLQSLLSKDPNIKLAIDKDLINPSLGNNKPYPPYQISFDNVYVLNEKGPWPSIKINKSRLSKVRILFYNSSKSHKLTIDTIENNPAINTNKINISPLSQGEIKLEDKYLEDNFLISCRFIKDKRRSFYIIDKDTISVKISVLVEKD